MSRHLVPRLVLVIALLAFGGCGGDDSPPPGGGLTPSSTIDIVPNAFNKGTMAFSPDTDSVRVNDIVRMRNLDTINHNIQTTTLGGPSWGSISAGGSVNAVAVQAGIFDFECTIGGHVMTGTLVVQP